MRKMLGLFLLALAIAPSASIAATISLRSCIVRIVHSASGTPLYLEEIHPETRGMNNSDFVDAFLEHAGLRVDTKHRVLRDLNREALMLSTKFDGNFHALAPNRFPLFIEQPTYPTFMGRSFAITREGSDDAIAIGQWVLEIENDFGAQGRLVVFLIEDSFVEHSEHRFRL